MVTKNVVKAVRATILLGDIELDVFQLPDGSYLSSAKQITDIVGLEHQRFAQILRSKEFQSLIPKGLDFTHFSTKKFVSNSGKHSGYTLAEVILIWQYAAFKGNRKAFALVVACGIESLEIRADHVFNVIRSLDEKNQLLSLRVQSKFTRRTLTDAISDWLDNPDNRASLNMRKFLYSNTSDKLNKEVLSMSSSKAKKELNLEANKLLRDFIPSAALKEIEYIESIAVRYIDTDNINPLEAVKLACVVGKVKSIGLTV